MTTHAAPLTLPELRVLRAAALWTSDGARGATENAAASSSRMAVPGARAAASLETLLAWAPGRWGRGHLDGEVVDIWTVWRRAVCPLVSRRCAP